MPALSVCWRAEKRKTLCNSALNLKLPVQMGAGQHLRFAPTDVRRTICYLEHSTVTKQPLSLNIRPISTPNFADIVPTAADQRVGILRSVAIVAGRLKCS